MSGVAFAGLELFECAVDGRPEEILLEAGELGANLINNLVSLLSNLLILRLDLSLFRLAQLLAYLLRLWELGHVYTQGDVVFSQEFTRWQLVL